MGELAKPDVGLPAWAIHRAGRIVLKLADIGPGKLAVEYVAVALALAWNEGRTSGLQEIAKLLGEPEGKTP